MHFFGSHLSIAGGYFRAVNEARRLGLDCVQIFTKNNNQWNAKPLSDDDISRFADSLEENQIRHPLSHASYLINLASPAEDLRRKSIESMIVELERADALGIPYVVFHPGAFTTSSESEGIDNIVRSLDEILGQTDGLEAYPLLENTAGQGSNLGWRFEHLKQIIDGVAANERLGVCIDTCHAFAAGYPMATKEEWKTFVDEMDRQFGLKRIKAIHLNDSKQPFASRKDRHEHIGEGKLGLEPFRNLLNDNRFSKIPMYLETEKIERQGEDMDVVNVRTLKSLVGEIGVRNYESSDVPNS